MTEVQVERTGEKCPLSSDPEVRWPIILVADAHLGLLKKYPKLGFGFFNNEAESDSVELSHFLEWVKQLRDGPQPLLLGHWGEDRWGKDATEVALPGTLVLLGDFVELWDASDAAIQFASHEIWRILGEIAETGELGVKIVYIIGNHDFAMKDLIWNDQLARRGVAGAEFPMGNSRIEIVEDFYVVPPARETRDDVPNKTVPDLPTIPVDETQKSRYVFLHGHQFDPLFRRARRWYPLVSYIRDGAEAFRLYSAVILCFTFLWAVLARWLGMFDWTPIVLLSILGAGPRLALWIARPLWNKGGATRYDPRKALDGFADWWEDFCKDRQAQEPIDFVVYGHTHLADIFREDEISEKTKKALQRGVTLINIPAWARDSSEAHEPVLRDAALYIDEQGPKFIGWNWKERKPFYIPDEIVRLRADGNALDDQIIQKLKSIGWPDEMLRKWRTPYREGFAGIERRNYKNR
jgi:UDP-2,3-diacylglucosamine pyrophosphatase LpxH